MTETPITVEEKIVADLKAKSAAKELLPLVNSGRCQVYQVGSRSGGCCQKKPRPCGVLSASSVYGFPYDPSSTSSL
jgi:hypothetical protein